GRLAALGLAAPSPAGAVAAVVKDESRPSLSLTPGTARAVLKLVKVKKKRLPAPSGDIKAPSGDDDAGGTDDTPATASSGSGDEDAKEDELLGGSSKAKKKEKPPAREEDAAGSGGGESDAAKATKSVETVEAKASEEPSGTTVASALEFGVGGKALFRQLSWTSDGANAGLGPYSLAP